MSSPAPRYNRPWAGWGIGWLCAVLVLLIVIGSLIPLWPWSERLAQICIGLLAAALLL